MPFTKLPTPLFWSAIVALLLVSFAIDFLNTAHGGAIDLRNRVTGIRLMAHGVDPYTYKWHSGDPDTALDVYNNPRLPVSKTTATPTLLLVLASWQSLPYRLSEFLWLLAQWVMLLGAMGCAWWSCALELRRTLVLFFTAFTYTAAWRLHAERGQAYIFLALIFVTWLAVTFHPRLRSNVGDWLGGFLAGVLIPLRPTFLLLLPFIVLHRRSQFLGAMLGLIIAAGVPLLVRGTCWSEYFAAMQINSELYRNDIDPAPGPQHYPGLIEGSPTDLVGAFSVIPYADFSCFGLLRAMGLDHIWLGNLAIPAWPPLALFGLGFAAWCGLSLRATPEYLAAGLASWIFLSDLVLPAYRDTYNDVLILPVFAAAFLVGARRFKWPVMLCADALPIGLLVYFTAPEQPFLINLPTTLCTAGAVWLVITTATPIRPVR